VTRRGACQTSSRLSAYLRESGIGVGAGARGRVVQPSLGPKTAVGGRHPPRRRRTIDPDRFRSPFPLSLPLFLPLFLHPFSPYARNDSPTRESCQALTSNVFVFFMRIVYVDSVLRMSLLASYISTLIQILLTTWSLGVSRARVTRNACMPEL